MGVPLVEPLLIRFFVLAGEDGGLGGQPVLQGVSGRTFTPCCGFRPGASLRVLSIGFGAFGAGFGHDVSSRWYEGGARGRRAARPPFITIGPEGRSVLGNGEGKAYRGGRSTSGRFRLA